jgi:hypothetical protein
MMHIHQWSRWEDVKLGDKAKAAPGLPVIVVRQVITQQRRCALCNMVKTRCS